MKYNVIDSKKCYNVVVDENLATKYCSLVFQDLLPKEVYWMCISNRKKYLTPEQRESNPVGDFTILRSSLLLEKSSERFLSILHGWEIPSGSYLGNDNRSFSGDGLVVYSNINPSNVLRGVDEFNKKMSAWNLEAISNPSEHSIDNFRHIDIMFKRCLQNTYSRKIWVDIDIDLDDPTKKLEVVDKIHKMYLSLEDSI